MRSTEFKLSKLKILDSHNNWKFIDRKNLKEGLFFEDYFQKRKLYNGYFYESNIEIKDFSLERLKDINLNKSYCIPKKLNNKELEYLFKVQTLCKENDIKLLAIKIPVINYYLDRENNGRKNIKYVDYNLTSNWTKLNLDYKKDFKDNGHLNQNGAEKLTNDINNILKGGYLN